MNKPLKAFITYAHKNRKAKDKLIEHLIGMQREGLISIWHDNEIVAGDKWREEIFSTNLPDSNLLLYLVSASSLYSENCNRELGIALEENIRPILIILEACDWRNYKVSNVQTVSTEGFRLGEWESQTLGDIQALPDEGKPLNEWDPESIGWKSVAVGLREAVQTILPQAELALQQGNFLMTTKQTDKAIEIYSRAIELNPNYAEAYSNRGIAYKEKGDYDRAIGDYTQAIGLESDYADAYYNRGNAYRDIGDIDRAIEDYNVAIELRPDYVEAYNNRAIAHSLQGNYGRTIEDSTTAIELDFDAKAHYTRSVVYLLTGNYNRAIEGYTRAIELNPDAASYFGRGVAQLAVGESENAKTDLTIARSGELDISVVFQSLYGSVADFEQKNRVQLPADIAAMLTPQQ